MVAGAAVGQLPAGTAWALQAAGLGRAQVALPTLRSGSLLQGYDLTMTTCSSVSLPLYSCAEQPRGSGRAVQLCSGVASSETCPNNADQAEINCHYLDEQSLRHKLDLKAQVVTCKGCVLPLSQQSTAIELKTRLSRTYKGSAAMSLGRAVPWASWEEWRQVGLWLLSEAPGDVQQGLDRVRECNNIPHACWFTVGILPPLVPAASAAATALLLFKLFALATALQALQVVI